MNFRIADTFTDSLAKLTGDEQKAVKTTAFDLQLDPVSSGMSCHRLDNAKDKNFWSVRVSRDIRLIVHKTDASMLLCYVDHHDNAYQWAERRKLETHPKTGAAQLVEIRERVEEIIVKKYIEVAQPKAAKPLLFAHFSNDELLGYGVPVEWLADARQANEDMSFIVLDDQVATTSGKVSISTMHLAKGLEFRAVAVMACDYEVIPLQQRIESVADDADLEEVYNTERHLLYVACTRARDHLIITSFNPQSEFLDDLGG